MSLLCLKALTVSHACRRKSKLLPWPISLPTVAQVSLSGLSPLEFLRPKHAFPQLIQYPKPLPSEGPYCSLILGNFLSTSTLSMAGSFSYFRYLLKICCLRGPFLITQARFSLALSYSGLAPWSFFFIIKLYIIYNINIVYMFACLLSSPHHDPLDCKFLGGTDHNLFTTVFPETSTVLGTCMFNRYLLSTWINEYIKSHATDPSIDGSNWCTCIISVPVTYCWITNHGI